VTLITDDAIEKIHEYAEGYPRRIAMLCHRSLRALVMHRERVIHSEMVEELLQEEQEGGWFQLKRLQKSSSSV
jgi:type II secretory pathway predicted ATPase ExeA